jgi:hypothetical protein
MGAVLVSASAHPSTAWLHCRTGVLDGKMLLDWADFFALRWVDHRTFHNSRYGSVHGSQLPLTSWFATISDKQQIYLGTVHHQVRGRVD